MTIEKPNARSMGYLLMDTRSQSDWEFSKSHMSYAVNSEITDVFLCVDFRKFLSWITRKYASTQVLSQTYFALAIAGKNYLCSTEA